MIAGGQRDDLAMLGQVLNDIHVPRLGGGKPSTIPEAVVADEAYGSRGNQLVFRVRGLRCFVPEKSDKIAARKRKGPRTEVRPA